MFSRWLTPMIDKWNTANMTEQIASVAVGIYIYLFGQEQNEFVRIAIMFMATDITLGVLAALYRGDFNSKIMRKGLIRKFGLITAIVVSHVADDFLGSGFTIKRFVCSAISGYEFLSNTETMAVMRIKVFPSWVINRFKQANLNKEAIHILDEIKEKLEKEDDPDKPEEKNE